MIQSAITIIDKIYYKPLYFGLNAQMQIQILCMNARLLVFIYNLLILNICTSKKGGANN